jgi:hypothetical protein
MRKLIVWIASAITVISVATARLALLGETSVVAPTLTAPHQPTDLDRGAGHLPRHGHALLFTS